MQGNGDVTMYIDGANIKLDANELVGQYVTPVRDVGYVASFAIAIDAVAAIATSLGFDTEPTRRFDSSATLRFVGEEDAGALSFEIKHSEDNITWTSWESFRKGDYYCRYFQLRMTMTRTGLDVNLLCSRFDYSTDLPDINEKGEDEVTDAGAGKSVVFAKTFHQEPIVNITIVDGTGVYYRHTAKDTTGFTVVLYNAAGAAVVGNFEWHAYGV